MMMKKMATNTITYILLLFIFLLSCSDDKGNYVYDDKEVITIEFPTQLTGLAFAEDINIDPTITSNLRGNIESEAQGFEFYCERKNSDGDWINMGVTDQKNVYIAPNLDAATYICRYSVINKDTGVRHSKLFYVRYLTTTTEGWMVLCNEGNNNRVRLDMLSQLSTDRIIPAHGVLKVNNTVPELYDAASLGFFANRRAIRNKIVLMSGAGAYLLPTEDENAYGSLVTLSEAYELKKTLFLAPTDETIVSFTTIACLDYTNHDAVMAISKEGNAFLWNVNATGAAFELPVNTSSRGGTPEYKVEPYVGTILYRYVSGMKDYGVALLYDKDNKRFIGWDSDGDKSGEAGRKQRCYPLSGKKEDKKLFNFNTGLDMVTMLNTLSTTHAILQDGSKRIICSINVMDKDFRQEGYYTDITAPNFNVATHYAASAQYPVIYYAYKNKVYSYNYATGDYKEAIVLGDNDNVTMLKFNRFDEPQGVSLLTQNMSEVFAAEFRARENELIVGSYDSTVSETDGGTLRFYQTASPGINLTLKPGWEYKGYAKIVDVKYKEVRR